MSELQVITRRSMQCQLMVASHITGEAARAFLG